MTVLVAWVCSAIQSPLGIFVKAVTLIAGRIQEL